jgi:hypothetical protein
MFGTTWGTPAGVKGRVWCCFERNSADSNGKVKQVKGKHVIRRDVSGPKHRDRHQTLH